MPSRQEDLNSNNEFPETPVLIRNNLLRFPWLAGRSNGLLARSLSFQQEAPPHCRSISDKGVRLSEFISKVDSSPNEEQQEWKNPKEAEKRLIDSSEEDKTVVESNIEEKYQHDHVSTTLANQLLGSPKSGKPIVRTLDTQEDSSAARNMSDKTAHRMNDKDEMIDVNFSTTSPPESVASKRFESQQREATTYNPHESLHSELCPTSNPLVIRKPSSTNAPLVWTANLSRETYTNDSTSLEKGVTLPKQQEVFSPLFQQQIRPSRERYQLFAEPSCISYSNYLFEPDLTTQCPELVPIPSTSVCHPPSSHSLDFASCNSSHQQRQMEAYILHLHAALTAERARAHTELLQGKAQQQVR